MKIYLSALFQHACFCAFMQIWLDMTVRAPTSWEPNGSLSRTYLCSCIVSLLILFSRNKLTIFPLHIIVVKHSLIERSLYFVWYFVGGCHYCFISGKHGDWQVWAPAFLLPATYMTNTMNSILWSNTESGLKNP